MLYKVYVNVIYINYKNLTLMHLDWKFNLKKNKNQILISRKNIET